MKKAPCGKLTLACTVVGLDKKACRELKVVFAVSARLFAATDYENMKR